MIILSRFQFPAVNPLHKCSGTEEKLHLESWEASEDWNIGTIGIEIRIGGQEAFESTGMASYRTTPAHRFPIRDDGALPEYL